MKKMLLGAATGFVAIGIAAPASAADIAASAYPYPEKMDELQARLDMVLAERPSRLEPLITGEDIMRIRGIGPGPEIGRIKQRLEELVIDGEVPPDRDAITNYLSGHPDL